jgi:hypothetical protein
MTTVYIYILLTQSSRFFNCYSRFVEIVLYNIDNVVVTRQGSKLKHNQRLLGKTLLALHFMDIKPYRHGHKLIFWSRTLLTNRQNRPTTNLLVSH